MVQPSTAVLQASSIQNYVENSKEDGQNAQRLQLLDAASSFAVAVLMPKGWQEPKTLLGGLVLRVGSRLGEETGRDRGSAISLKEKLLAVRLFGSTDTPRSLPKPRHWKA